VIARSDSFRSLLLLPQLRSLFGPLPLSPQSLPVWGWRIAPGSKLLGRFFEAEFVALHHERQHVATVRATAETTESTAIEIDAKGCLRSAFVEWTARLRSSPTAGCSAELS
jgi:hypothetical protein